MIRPVRRLSATLWANAAFSALSGLAMAAAPARAAAFLGDVPPWLIQGVGAGLIVFALTTVLEARRPRPAGAAITALLDLGWLVLSVPVLLTGVLGPEGRAALLAVNAVVALFAVLQLRFLCGWMTNRLGGPGRYRHCVRFALQTPPGEIWQVIRDMGAISRYSDALAFSRMRGGAEPAPGAVRECGDPAGNRWSEEVTEIDDGARRLRLRFMSEVEGFPFPVTEMTGGWTVDPGETGSLVEIWWSLMPKAPMGWLLVALMSRSLDRTMAEVLWRMEKETGAIPATTAPRATMRPGIC